MRAIDHLIGDSMRSSTTNSKLDKETKEECSIQMGKWNTRSLIHFIHVSWIYSTICQWLFWPHFDIIQLCQPFHTYILSITHWRRRWWNWREKEEMQNHPCIREAKRESQMSWKKQMKRKLLMKNVLILPFK